MSSIFLSSISLLSLSSSESSIVSLEGSFSCFGILYSLLFLDLVASLFDCLDFLVCYLVIDSSDSSFTLSSLWTLTFVVLIGMLFYA